MEDDLTLCSSWMILVSRMLCLVEVEEDGLTAFVFDDMFRLNNFVY